MPPDALLALILGVLLTIRRLDVTRRRAEDHPEAPSDSFERWQSRARRAYLIGSSASFAKVLLDLLFVRLAVAYSFGPSSVRAIGASIFFAWVAAMVFVVREGLANRRFANDVGLRVN